MTARRAGLAALTLGLIAAALLHGRMAIPPVYDGIIVPPEPYRWESPPPNLAAGNKPPLPGDVTLPIQNGQVAGGGVQTGDNQVVIYFGPGAFKEIQFNDGTGWRPLPTLTAPGGDPYASVNAPGFGEYAASAPGGAAGPTISSDLGRYLEFFGILAFVILFGAIAIFQEIRRRRHRTRARPRKRT